MYLVGYNHTMNILQTTHSFDQWLKSLQDQIGKARILKRLSAAESGAWGDCDNVGEGVAEMRIHCGPGYRVYFTRVGDTVYLLLAGGDKTSQKRDIKTAIAMAKTLRGT
jgi:putative addiction module killer protein